MLLFKMGFWMGSFWAGGLLDGELLGWGAFGWGVFGQEVFWEGRLLARELLGWVLTTLLHLDGQLGSQESTKGKSADVC